MACYHPINGWRSFRRNPFTGKRPVVFDLRDAILTSPVVVPCGNCVGCRLERARQWSIRCLHEAQMHEENCVVTLTYDDDHLPYNRSLCKRDFQLFMKRLRKKFPEKRIRYFHCGEYGERFKRPHYHVLLFGFDFPDKLATPGTRAGSKEWVSQMLLDVWGNGRATVGELNFNSAAYVARYVLKKHSKRDVSHYEVVAEDGECLPIEPEYVTMSRRPGIGRDWFEAFRTDVFPHDFVVVKGARMRPPKYYDRCYELTCPSDFALLQIKRRIDVRSKPELSSLRLHQMEQFQLEVLKNKKRNYEEDG